MEESSTNIPNVSGQQEENSHSCKPLVIASSYSFAPRCGSEAGIGWNTVASLAKNYRVLVISASHYEKHLTEEDLKELSSKGIRVRFFACTSKFHFVATFSNKFAGRLRYISWQHAVRKVIQDEIYRNPPALLTHISWGTGTVPCPLIGLGVPVLHGPVGGF